MKLLNTNNYYGLKLSKEGFREHQNQSSSLHNCILIQYMLFIKSLLYVCQYNSIKYLLKDKLENQFMRL